MTLLIATAPKCKGCCVECVDETARPDADISTGLWGAVPLWDKIDEPVADDASSFVRRELIFDIVEQPSFDDEGNEFEVGLSDFIDFSKDAPGPINPSHIVRLRTRQKNVVGAGVTFSWRIRLAEGLRVVREFNNSNFREDIWDTRFFQLSQSEVLSITDPSDLRIRVAVQARTRNIGAHTVHFDLTWMEYDIVCP